MVWSVLAVFVVVSLVGVFVHSLCRAATWADDEALRIQLEALDRDQNAVIAEAFDRIRAEEERRRQALAGDQP